MIKDLVTPNDPILLKVATEIPDEEITTPQTKKLIQKILNSSLGRRKDPTRPLLVGLAAPQIGISKRIIAVDIGVSGNGNVSSNLKIYINPEITWYSKETNIWYEGCWSTDRVCGIVERPTKIKVRAFTKEGERIEQEFEGYTARIFQHEIDHLNGKEFVTHITEDNNLHWVEEEEFPEYRNNEAWRTWKKLCPREKWEEIKGIK
jgi:peptide deformylase